MAADESLLIALGDRVRVFLGQGRDPAAVVAPQALSDADAVLRAVKEGRFDRSQTARALYLVASLHWARFQALPTGRNELNYLAAKQFFGYIAPLSPERVPLPLRPLLLPPPAGGDPAESEAEDRIAALAQLGTALTVRFRHQQQPGDAEAAVDAYREAVTLARDAADPQTPILVANLAGAMLLAGATDLPSLNGVITLIDNELPGADGRGAQALLSNLAMALRHRFQLTRAETDLIRAVRAARRRADLLPAEGAARANALATLAVMLGTLFEMTGRPADLTAAVTAARDAVTARDPDRMIRAGHLTNLGNLLRIRYEQYRSREDLDEGISVNAEARVTAPDHRAATAMWSNTSAALRERFRMARDPADLTAAIDAARSGLAVASPGSQYVVPCTIHLACALLDHHHDNPSVDVVREAVTLLRAAAEGLSPDHRFYGPAQVNLGVGLRTLYEMTGERADLDAAVLAGRAGHTTLTIDDPSRAVDALNLGQSLQTCFEQTADDEDAEAAVALFQEAVEAVAAPAQVRMDAARAWANLESDRNFGSPASVTAYRTAIGLMPLVAWRGLPSAEREDLLAGYAGLVDDAAAAAIQAGRLAEAVELVDAGRAVLWAQWLATQGDFSELAADAPALSARLRELRAVLDADPATIPADQRMAAAQQWEAAVDEARRLPGHSRFLQQPSFEQLRGGLPDGTTVVLTVSHRRCDALLLTRNHGAHRVRLPALTFDDAYDRTNELLRAHETADSGGELAGYEAAITAIQDWLWNAVAEPVLAEMDRLGYGRRVWWCPTGPLTLLPLHAAASADGEQAVLDRVVSSYTPTVRMLAAASRPGDEQPGGVLAVIQPATPGFAPLPNAVRERELLAELTGGQLTDLTGEQATRAAVAAHIADHSIAHFSCHGVQNPRDPSRSGLAVHDGFLTVADLRAQAPTLRGDFAFLSACRTAAGGVRLLDEALTVAAALHHLGYRRVIGTLWSVPDRRAADVSAGVYRRILAGGRLDAAASAQALHDAVLQLRRRFPNNPSVWASFVHLGW
jgi:CHAT domain-containing protein